MADGSAATNGESGGGATGTWTEPDAGLAPHEAMVLAHDSRKSIVEVLGRSPSGNTVAELADSVELHPNAVRHHLDVLSRAGVVVAARSPRTGRRGRPGMRYSLAAPHAVAGVAGRELVRLLLELVRRSGVSSDTAEELGVEQGAGLVDEGARPDALVAAFAGLGFAPQDLTTADDRRVGRLEMELRACPFKDAVLSPGGELICALHRGLVRGALGRLAPEATLRRFEIKDPITAGCRVAASGLPRD